MNKEKLTMITLFSGVGMQERGFQNSNLFDLEVIGTSEIDADATLAYAAVHCGLTPEMISEYHFPDVSEMATYLTDRKVGWDFQKNKGKDWFTYKKGKKLEDLKKYYLASVLQNNYGDISSIRELPYADFWTYSFPCTDISIAGKQEGLETTCNDCGHKFNPMKLSVEERHICPICHSTNIKGTRSGLLAEVERLLTIAEQNKTLPKYLLLENVKNLVGRANKPDFDAWLHRLSALGYHTYWAVLNAKQCGIPQNRERCFAISIRKDVDTGNFTFPQPFDNGLRLKDILEKDVEEKYYINTERAANLIEQLVEKGQLKGQRVCADSTINDPNTRDISNCITARYDASIQNQKQIGLVVCEPNVEQKRLGGMFDDDKGKHQAGSVWDTDGLAPTLDTMQGGHRQPCIIEDTNQVFNPLKDKTEYGWHFEQQVYDPKGIARTVKAGGGSGNIPKVIEQIESNDPQFVIGSTQKNAYVGDGSISSTLTSAMGEGGGHVPMIGFEDTTKPIYLGNTTPSGKSQCNAVYSTDGVSQTLCAGTHGYATGSILEESQKLDNIINDNIANMYRIRKLTPNECWVLMGLTKEDCMKAANLGISNSALYKIAGNGIVTNCIKLIAEHLFKAQYNPTYVCADENFQNPQSV